MIHTFKNYSWFCGVCKFLNRFGRSISCEKGHGNIRTEPSPLVPPCRDFVHVIANDIDACRNLVLTFGKYKGKTLAAVHKEDLDYCRWIIAKSTNGKIVSALKKLMKIE